MVVTAMRRGCCFGEIQTGVFGKSWNTFYNLLSNGSGKKRHIYLYSYGERQNERERERKGAGKNKCGKISTEDLGEGDGEVLELFL